MIVSRVPSGTPLHRGGAALTALSAFDPACEGEERIESQRRRDLLRCQ